MDKARIIEETAVRIARELNAAAIVVSGELSFGRDRHWRDSDLP